MTKRGAWPISLNGKLIDGSGVDHWLRQAIARQGRGLLVCSAYIRSEALRSILEGANKTVSGKVLARWRYQDLVSGASDLGVFDLCRKFGLDLYIRQDFHGKVYAVPEVAIAVGSANATLSGLGMTPKPNLEVGTLVDVSPENLAVVAGLFEGATPVDGELVALMARALPVDTPARADGWPQSIASKLIPVKKRQSLLVDECFWSSGDWLNGGRSDDRSLVLHDLAVLGVGVDAEKAEIVSAFQDSPMYSWLVTFLQNCPGQTAYFGSISVALHNVLLDDPRPWRSTVKQLLQNLLAWIDNLGLETVHVDRPNFSQRIVLRTEA